MIKRLRDSILITLITFLLMLSLVSLNLNLEIFNPIQNVFDDFDMTDVVFSYMYQEPKPNEDIVIVNFGNVNRGELAEMIRILNKYEPKVIGIDAFYRKPTDPLIDSALAAAFSEVKNLVLISKVNQYNEKKKMYDTLEFSNQMFNQYAQTGFANLSTSGEGNMTDFLTARTFIPKTKVLNKNEVAFAVKIAELYKPKAAKEFLSRNNESEFINFKGNIGGKDLQQKGGEAFFPSLDVGQVLNEEFEGSIIKGRIVLLGYMGASLSEKSFDDKFYTPLNKNYVGKSTPDMFGLVVHANIVAMILDGEFINEMNTYLNYTLVVLVVILSVMLFSYFHQNVGYWFDAITILFQLVISGGLLLILILVFHWYRLKIDISAALLGVVLSGIMTEIYYGLITKLFTKLKKQEK